MSRSGWGVASSIYNWIAGVFGVLSGLAAIILSGFVLDALNQISAFSGVGFIAILPIIIGIIYTILGILRCVVGYGLLGMQNWARITAVVLHIIFGLWNLTQVILLIQADLIGISVMFMIIFLANIVLTVGLLLPGTAAAYAGFGGSMGGAVVGRQTQLAPMNNFPPQFAPTQAAPSAGGPAQFQPAPAPGSSNTAAYAQPRPAGVARTEVAGASGPQVIAWLVERNGPRAGREHRLDNQITIGRDSARCELVLDDSKISGEHARVRFEQGRYILFDLASTNHIYVNNQEVQKHVLNDGDQIRLGPNVQLTFVQAGRP